jgi:toxin ParE1/3/4
VKRVAYHRLAVRELFADSAYYERCSSGLGEEFIAVVEAAVGRLGKEPLLGRPEDSSIRSWKTNRFPYRIVYQIRPDRIWVVAVMHLSRKPGYWKRRLD